MDLILRPSGGQNVVLRPMARPAWYPTGTVDAHQVEVFWQELDADGRAVGAPISLGKFAADAVVSIPYNPVSADAKVRVYAVSYSAAGVPDVAELRDAVQATVLFSRTAVAVGGIDEHVPTVTLAPMIAKEDGADFWLVFAHAPDDYAATLTDGEVWVEAADDADVYEVWPMGTVPPARVAQKAFPCKVRYRWRNQTSEDAGQGRGWSAWSPYADAAEVGAAAPPPPPGYVLSGFTFDANDSRAGIEKGVIQE